MKHLTILAQFQEISSRTGFPVEAADGGARAGGGPAAGRGGAEQLERARLDFEIAEAVTRCA